MVLFNELAGIFVLCAECWVLYAMCYVLCAVFYELFFEFCVEK